MTTCVISHLRIPGAVAKPEDLVLPGDVVDLASAEVTYKPSSIFGSLASFVDPHGCGWLIQEVNVRIPRLDVWTPVVLLPRSSRRRRRLRRA